MSIKKVTKLSKSIVESPTYVEHLKTPIVYPSVNFYTGDIVQYPSHYGNHAKKMLQLKESKKVQVYADISRKFIAQQREEEETSMAVPKEILVLGRSNSGKSSLLNKLLNQKVSNVSKKPGKTKNLIYHEINNGKTYLVDSPGYGWSTINVNVKERWLKMIKMYMRESQRLSRIYFLINLEHGLKDIDLEFIEYANSYNHPMQLLLTKADKVKDKFHFDRALSIGQQIKKYQNVSPVAHIVSAKQDYGIKQVKQSIASSIIDYYSKFEIETLQNRDRFAKLQQAEEIPIIKSSQPKLPDNEKYKMLIKSGLKPTK